MAYIAENGAIWNKGNDSMNASKEHVIIQHVTKTNSASVSSAKVTPWE